MGDWGTTPSQRETIFTDGKWTIEADPEFPENFDYVTHKCAWKKNWLLGAKPLSVYTMDKLQTCQHCGTEIPDSIVGLWKLKNFDKLQILHQSQSASLKWQGTGSFYLLGTAKSGTLRAGPWGTWEFYPS
jgi:hypothetical protein